MQRQAHARLFRHGENLIQEPFQPAPQLLRRGGRNRPGRRRGVIDHVPDHAVGHGQIVRAFHADGRRLTARIVALGPARDAGDGKIIAHDRNPRLSQPADDRLDVLDVQGALRAIEQNVVPVGRVEVLDGLQPQPRGLHLDADLHQLRERPQLMGIAGQPPAIVRARGLIIVFPMHAAAEIIDQVRHDMRRARLPRELEVLARQHMAVEAEAEFHG